MTEWYKSEGVTGELHVENRDGSWYVSEPSSGEEIQCIFEDDELAEAAKTKECIEATVSKFKQAIDGSTSYLFLSRETGKETVSEPSNSMWELSEFRGSGEYVDVEATIDSIFFVKKDVGGMPDIKGELTDDSVLNPVTFIIEGGTSHPYLEEGKEFLFRNVKDHFYKKQAEVQVVISDNTDFIEK